jgi:signal peptidase I
MVKKQNGGRSSKSFLNKVWYFIWYDDSILSWIVNVVLAFLIVKFLFYPGLALITGTSLPLVAVISPSMEHRVSEEGSVPTICGQITDRSGRLSLEEWWDECGYWYVENTDVTLDDFRDFPLRNGFNKGDIILLRGPKDLEVGDIIVFESGKPYPIIHRIVDIDYDLVTKGDNNAGLIRDSQLDEANVSHDVVIGKAYARIPYLGYIKIWFSDFLSIFV